MKIVKLDIDENSILAGVDAVALVEQPAIEEDFMYFSKQEFAETFDDYPQSAIDAAEQGIKRNKENDNKCATQVGKVRAQQLVNGENLSLDTIKRMRSFLIRQKDNYDLAISRKDYDACGYISYLLWGGPSALPWAEKKLRQAGIEFADESEIIEEIIRQEMSLITHIDGLPAYTTITEAEDEAKVMGCVGSHSHTLESGEVVYMPCDTHAEATSNILLNNNVEDLAKTEFSAVDEKQMLVGPLMVPSKLILRLDEFGEEYFVYFTAETIKKTSYKMMKDKMVDKVNIEHDMNESVEDAYMVESWIIDNPATDKSKEYGFNLPKGSWMGMYKIDNKNVWNNYVKKGKVRGFSIEGFFENEIVKR